MRHVSLALLALAACSQQDSRCHAVIPGTTLYEYYCMSPNAPNQICFQDVDTGF